MSEEESREQVEDIINNNEEFMGVSRDPLDGRDKVLSPPVKEAVIIEEVKE